MSILRSKWTVLGSLAFVGALAASDLSGQLTVDRTPNLSGGWTGTEGTVYFNFVHRFWHVDVGDEDKVVNSPTFLLGVPLPGRVLLGVNFASNSLVDGEEFNESEYFGRWAPISTSTGAPVDVGVTAAFNEAANSGDFELSVAVPVGPLTLHGVGRFLSDLPDQNDDAGWAVGGGATIHLNDHMAISGDVITLTERDVFTIDSPAEKKDVAWGAALQLTIPSTPHSVSFQITNARTTTLQGTSFGDGETRYGFEFTVPFTLSRYFGKRGNRSTGDTGGDVQATVTMTDQLRYSEQRVRIRAGQAVRWTNTSNLIHTVTADPSKAANAASAALPAGARPFDSGEMRPGDDYTKTFTVPGEYRYFCIPHEGAGMVATVVVTM